MLSFNDALIVLEYVITKIVGSVRKIMGWSEI